MRNIILKFLALFFLSAAANAQNQKKGLEFAENFSDLPYFKKGIQTYQLSSTDPLEDQFNDYSHWLYSDADSNAVLADIKGPGTIYRIWTTGNSGDSTHLKIIVDGKEQVNETFNKFHSHAPLRQKPQVGDGGDHYLAWWSYMPISFRDSIRIMRKGNLRPFYNITYHTYTDKSNVKSWTGRESLSGIEKMWNHPNQDPKLSKGNILRKAGVQIKPGDSSEIFADKGAGYIASLKISNYPYSKNFRLKIYWDGESVPSVDAPVKWFFGSVDNGGDVRALGIGTSQNTGYCYFPMPYWRQARIVLVNQTDSSSGKMEVAIAYNKRAYPEKDCGYFHAKANDEMQPGKKYSCLKTQGHGHVVGMAKRMPAGGHACEGDEIFYIDGRKFPDIYGTGEEDYSNCAWWKNSYNSYPTHGAVGNDCYYRLHYPDLLVYEQAIDMEFESWSNHYIASLVWYYEKDLPSLIKTDSVDVGDEDSEKRHGWNAGDVKWAGKRTGKYPGLRIYDEELSDDGKAISGKHQFKVVVDPKNKGVRLRLRTVNTNFPLVNVWVDGKLVEERVWQIMKNKYDAIWIDSDFEIPAKYTSGKAELSVTLEHKPGTPDWVAFRYDVYSYLQ